jgi:2'-5' RNA ligase
MTAARTRHRSTGPAGRAPRPAPRAPEPEGASEPRPRNHFFALLPPPAVRDALARLAATLPERVGGRAEPAQRLHLTLLFLGPLPAGHEAALRAAGEAARAATGPFGVELDHLGRFERSDAVWVGPSAPPEPGLRALHAALRRACAAVPTSRPPGRFSPHLTLLRDAARDAGAPADRVGPWRWTADRFALMRTDPSPQGRVYTSLGAWRLHA